MKHIYLLLNICILRILRYPSVKTQDTLFNFTWYSVLQNTDLAKAGRKFFLMLN